MSIVGFYVEDLLLTRDNEVELHEMKHFLNAEFNIKYLGNAYFFFGMEIIRESKGLILS